MQKPKPSYYIWFDEYEGLCGAFAHEDSPEEAEPVYAENDILYILSKLDDYEEEISTKDCEIEYLKDVIRSLNKEPNSVNILKEK